MMLKDDKVDPMACHEMLTHVNVCISLELFFARVSCCNVDIRTASHHCELECDSQVLVIYR